jgi:hypothetical protein
LNGQDAFIIGGAQIYQQALPLADKLIVTEIGQSFARDAFFSGDSARDMERNATRRAFFRTKTITLRIRYIRKNLKGNTMSGHGFHVHGPHDHELEHAAHGNDDFASRIAVMTAIMATVGASVWLRRWRDTK